MCYLHLNRSLFLRPQAQAKAGGDAEAEADEPGENGGKSESEEAAQETPDKAAPTDKTAAVDVQAEGTAKEEVSDVWNLKLFHA